MNQTTKTRSFHAFRVDVLNIENSDPATVIWDTLTDPDQYNEDVSKRNCRYGSSGYRVEIRNVRRKGTDWFMGAMCKCREDAPPLRRADGKEVLQTLRNGDTLLEKNFFLYARTQRVLIWQSNPAANGQGAFTQMLETMSGATLTFACLPVVMNEHVLTQDSEIEVVDFRVVAPNTKKARRALMNQDPTDWGVMNPFQLMGQAEAKQFSAIIKSSRNQSLGDQALKFITALSGNEQTRKLKVKLSEVDEPIDLLTSRFKRREEVTFNGHHLDRSSMYDALERVWANYCANAASDP